MSEPEHDPFCFVDYDAEMKKNNKRIEESATKMLENFKTQIQHYLQANNTQTICIHMDVHVDGRWSFKLQTRPDVQKTLDCIELGHPQDFQ